MTGWRVDLGRGRLLMVRGSMVVDGIGEGRPPENVAVGEDEPTVADLGYKSGTSTEGRQWKGEDFC